MNFTFDVITTDSFYIFLLKSITRHIQKPRKQIQDYINRDVFKIVIDHQAFSYKVKSLDALVTSK